jgi:aminoglycoside phosphotransferase (APT) family kinase protein
VVEPPPTDPGPYLSLAERHLPQIPLGRARPMNSGWGCFVLDANNQWILRFPRTPADARRVELESRLLRELEKRLPVPIPHYEHIIRAEGGRILFVAYPKLHGRHLPARGLTGARSKAWAADLIDLLAALTGFPRSLGEKLGVTWWRQEDAVARWKYLYPLIRERVHPLLPAGIRKKDREYWETYVEEARTAKRPTILTHGDFSGEHILVNDQGITGVLDWESACFEDPVGDITMLPQADGFADRVAKGRFGANDIDWTRRVAFHRHAAPVYSILYGLEHRNLPTVRQELVRYRRTLPK